MSRYTYYGSKRGRNRSNVFNSNYANSPTHRRHLSPLQICDPKLLPKKEWTAENAQRAIDAEIEIGLQRESVIMTFPDPIITLNSILNISPAIKHVKFDRNIRQRSCYVNPKNREAVPEVIKSLKQLKFDGVKPEIETRNYSGPSDKVNLTNINPYVLYISNIDNAGDLPLVKKCYLPGVIIKAGVEEWKKTTHYVHMQFPSIETAIEALRRNNDNNFKVNNRRLKVRFLRKDRSLFSKSVSNLSLKSSGDSSNISTSASTESSGRGKSISDGDVKIKVEKDDENPNDSVSGLPYDPNFQVKKEFPSD